MIRKLFEWFKTTPGHWLLIGVSILFILGGSVNNGWTGFFWAIPFCVLLIFQLLKISRLIAVIVTAVVAAVSIFVWEHPENKLIYPFLGSEVSFLPGWVDMQFSDSADRSLSPPEDAKFQLKHEKVQPEFYARPSRVIENIVPMKLVSVKVTHADLGTQLLPIMEDIDGNRYSLADDELLEGIKNGTANSSDLQNIKSLQSSWSVWLGNLMFWPATPVIIFGVAGDLFK